MPIEEIFKMDDSKDNFEADDEYEYEDGLDDGFGGTPMCHPDSDFFDDRRDEDLDYCTSFEQEDFTESECDEFGISVVETDDSMEDDIRVGGREFYSNKEIDECLEGYFRLFGKRDMDIIYLYFLSGKKQEEIMSILGKSQPAISYDVQRIRRQAQFVKKIMSYLNDFIEFITNPNNPLRTDDKELLLVFFYSTSIVKTARIMRLGNITCRSHLNTVIKRLQGIDDEMFGLFKYILSHLNNIKKHVSIEKYAVRKLKM